MNTPRPPELAAFLHWLDGLPYHEASQAAGVVFAHDLERFAALMPPIEWEAVEIAPEPGFTFQDREGSKPGGSEEPEGVFK